MVEKGSSIADSVKECLDSLALVRGDKLDSVSDAYRGADDALLEELLTRPGADALRELGPRLEAVAQSARSSASLGEKIDDRTGKVVLAWAQSVSAKHELHLAPLLDAARGHGPDDDVASAARARVRSGPLFDALVCLALTGDARWLVDEAADPDLARVDLLLWEASAGAVSIPELGPWLWTEPVARQALIYSRARGSLRERSLAASAVAIAADGIPLDTIPVSAVAMTTRVIFELASHPEAVVWIPAARALGRLAGRVPTVRPQLLRWRTSKHLQRRRRAITALASLPGDSSEWIDEHLEKLLDTRDPWELASIGPAVPYLARERSELWEMMSERLLERDGAEVPWSMTAGLLALNRTERADARTESLLRRTRERCLQAKPKSVAEAQLWQITRRNTDFLDGFDPDPSFPDVLLDRAVRDAIRVGGSAVLHRASSVAKGIRGTFEGSLRRASTSDHLDDRGHAIVAVESCTRAAALALWEPILESVGSGDAGLNQEISAAREHMGDVFAGLLEREELEFGLRRSALRALGNLIDATSPVGRKAAESRGRVAAFSLAALANSRWARDLSRGEMNRFRKPVTDLLWRVSDALQTRPTSRSNSPGGLGPLAAWWMLCVGGIEFLQLMHHDSEAAEHRISEAIRTIRDSCHAAVAGAALANWSADVLGALEELGAGHTMLAYAVDRLIGALDAVESALEPGVERPFALEFLAESIALLGELARDPVTALASESWDDEAPASDDSLIELYQRAVQTGSPSARDVAESWAAPVGPMLRPLVANTVRRGVIARRGQALAAAQKDRVGPYSKLRKLGGGGQAEVWLVKRDGPRRYVMKIPRAPLSLRPTQRDELKRLLRREAKLLESLHEAKVASFCDHGWDGDTPYLVLQYLIGTDLAAYSNVRAVTVAELKPIVRDVCLGLRALHERGIVHRDLKPSNVFLRLQLPRDSDETFQEAHRDPKLARLSEAVLIDLGIAALLTDSAGASAEGTLGYLSPEQAQMSDDLSGKSDVYGLAATIFSAMTGRRFFQEHTARTAGVIAHALEIPFENESVRRAAEALPGPLVTLLRWATELDPADRPDADDFSDAFAVL